MPEEIDSASYRIQYRTKGGPRCGRDLYQEPFVLQKTLGVETFSGLITHVIETARISEAAEALESSPKEHAVAGEKKGGGTAGRVRHAFGGGKKKALSVGFLLGRLSSTPPSRGV